MLPHRIMVIRHGEKPSGDGSVLGVDMAGSPHPDELSVRGWQRAGALARFFTAPHGVRTSAIQQPTFFFAPGVNPGATSLRGVHTLGPLADFLGKAVSTRFCKGEEPALVSAIAKLPGAVLVAWEHQAIIDIGNALMGGSDRTPQVWPDDRFDLVWAFEHLASGWRFSQVPQLLLAGDSAAPL